MNQKKRKALMIELGDRLRQIKIANGFSSDLGDQVFWAKPNPIEYKTDCIVYMDDSESFEDKNSLRDNQLEICIDAYLWNKEAIGYGVASSDALDDIVMAIAPIDPITKEPDPTLGISGNILYLKESANTVELEGASAIKRKLIIGIDYETEIWGN